MPEYNYISPSVKNNPVKNFSTSSDDIKALLQSSGIYDRLAVANSYNLFTRFGIMDPYNEMTTTKEYVFITKPDLNLFQGTGINPSIANNSYLVDMYNRFNPVMKQLSYNSSKSNGPFIQLLSNMIVGGLDLPGISADNIETNANIYGTSISYRGSSYKSDEKFGFSMEFKDSKYLEVYNLFKIYDEYERLKRLGFVMPPNINYIYRRMLHDKMSIYKFVVAEDGMTLIYWARLMGVTFDSVPREAFGDMTNNEGQRLTVSCSADFVEDMGLRILSDFNTIISESYSDIYNKPDLPIYNKEIQASEGRWALTPYIAHTSYSNTQKAKMGQMKLLWKASDSNGKFVS